MTDFSAISKLSLQENRTVSVLCTMIAYPFEDIKHKTGSVDMWIPLRNQALMSCYILGV